MAKKTTPKETPTEEGMKAHAARLELLQTTVDDICERITDSPARSLLARAIRARSVAPAVVNAAFDAIDAAVADARQQYAAAQNGDDTGRASRVDLKAL